MSVSDEIEVAKITIDEATISWIKATIALPSLTTLVMQWRQRNLPKKVLHVQSFCFANFLIPVVVVIALSLVVVLPRKTILDMRRLRLKTDDLMETRDEINVRRYPYKGSLLVDFRDNRMVFPFYIEHHSSTLSLFFLEKLAFPRGYM